MKRSGSNRNGGDRGSGPHGPASPDFVQLDPDEAAEYGAFRDDVDLEDVLEADDDSDGPADRNRHGV